MNKRKVGRTFSRKRDVRKAFLKSLLRAFAIKGSIHTTEARVKELRPLVERLVTRAKRGTLEDKRHLAIMLGLGVSREFADVTGKKYKDRTGGFTRVIKTAPRKSDAARMAIIEFV